MYNSVDKIANTIFHFMLLNILFTDAEVAENTIVTSKLKTTVGGPRSRSISRSPHHMQRNHTSTRSLQVVIRSSLSIDERLALGNAAGEFPEARHADLGAAEQPPWKRDGASCGQL